MSLFNELKNDFQSKIKVPIVFNEAGKFQVFGHDNLHIVYGFEGGTLPELPPVTYKSLYKKTYYFKDWRGNSEKDFIPHKNTILKYSYDCLADAMEKFVVTDEPLPSSDLLSADDLASASESFGEYHSNSYISLGIVKYSMLNSTILNGRTQIQPTELPFAWNYLDSQIPFFTHGKKDLLKAIVFKIDESFVISDVSFDIYQNLMRLTFFIGASSADKIKVFNLT